MECKKCGNTFGEFSPLEKITFSTMEKITEVINEVYKAKSGKIIMDLSDPYIEFFDREVVYQCGNCDTTYSEDEVIALFTKEDM